MELNELTQREWSDAIWLLLGLFILLVVIKLIVKSAEMSREEEEIRGMFLKPEERKKLYNDTNGSIKDRNRRVMDQIEHSTQFDCYEQ